MGNGQAPDWWLNGGGTQQDWDALPPATVRALQGTPNPNAAPKTIKMGGQTFEWVDDGTGKFSWQPVNAGGGGGGAANYHLDPRELALEYAKLQGTLTEAQMADLKDLIMNRNTESVGLANAYTSAAEKAAAFQQHPENAIADVAYRNAVFGSGQGATPYGSTENQPFQDRQRAMWDTFKQMFGPAADALKRAGEFIGSIPPSEYLSPPSVTAGAGSAGGGGGGGASAPPSDAAPLGTGGGSTAPRPVTSPSGTGPGPLGFSKGGTIGINPTLPGGGPRVGMSSSEGGTNMNIHEPAMIVGKSGHVYATMSEVAPEQLIIKPLPSVQKAQKDNDAFMKATAGAKRNQAGGTLGVDPLGDPSVFLDTIRKAFNLRGIYTGANQVLPDPRLLAGDAGEQLMEDPTMRGYITSAYSSLPGGGIKPAELDYTINRFRPAGIHPQLPKVVF